MACLATVRLICVVLLHASQEVAANGGDFRNAHDEQCSEGVPEESPSLLQGLSSRSTIINARVSESGGRRGHGNASVNLSVREPPSNLDKPQLMEISDMISNIRSPMHSATVPSLAASLASLSVTAGLLDAQSPPSTGRGSSVLPEVRDAPYVSSASAAQRNGNLGSSLLAVRDAPYASTTGIISLLLGVAVFTILSVTLCLGLASTTDSGKGQEHIVSREQLLLKGGQDDMRHSNLPRPSVQRSSGGAVYSHTPNSPQTPQSQSMPFESASPGYSPSQDFCQELVVPQGKECVLLVPSLRAATPGQGRDEVLHVTDQEGCVCLCLQQGSFTVSEGGGLRLANPGQREKISLLSTNRQRVLAYCVQKGDPPKSFHIHRADDELFARLFYNDRDGYYKLDGTVGNAGSLRFCGQVHNKISIMDDQPPHGLYAYTEVRRDSSPASGHITLRVGPLVDVGLILCGLLAMVRMEAQRMSIRSSIGAPSLSQASLPSRMQANSASEQPRFIDASVM